jgi:branched-chain amino acid transport system ATP-binding protein
MIVEKGISMVPEGRKIFSRLTVRENLEMGGYTKPDVRVKENIERIFEILPLLKDRQKQAGGTLSGGEQQMLAIGRGLMSDPKILLLDEPSLGLSPIMEEKVFEIIRDINAKGVTILLIEQNANMALKTADTGYVMETGNIVMSGKAEELLVNSDIKKAYLGV